MEEGARHRAGRKSGRPGIKNVLGTDRQRKAWLYRVKGDLLTLYGLAMGFSPHPPWGRRWRRGKGHQGPHLGLGTSRGMPLEHCMGALHGSIDPSLAADGLDPSAICGGPHEVLCWIRNQPVMVDHAVLPGLLGGAEWARGDMKEKDMKEKEKSFRTKIWAPAAELPWMRSMRKKQNIETSEQSNKRSGNNTNRTRDITRVSRSMYVTIEHGVMIDHARHSIEQHDMNTRMPRSYCACSQVTYEYCYCRYTTRAHIIMCSAGTCGSRCSDR